MRIGGKYYARTCFFIVVVELSANNEGALLKLVICSNPIKPGQGQDHYVMREDKTFPWMFSPFPLILVWLKLVS